MVFFQTIACALSFLSETKTRREAKLQDQLTYSPNLHLDEIRMADCLGCSGEIGASPFVRRSSPGARVRVTLTTKLTTYRLDVLGRRWTIRRQ
jgi:hypothetical protein